MTASIGFLGTYITFFGCVALGGQIASYRGLFIRYSSPTVLIAAIGIFMFFTKINVPKKASGIISFFAPSVFSVYLIHDNASMRPHILEGNFSFLTTANPLVMFLSVPLIAFGIFLVCIFIDKIRALLFKLLKTDRLSEKFAAAVEKAVNEIYRLLAAKLLCEAEINK